METKVPLRVCYIKNGTSLPEHLEQGVLYFVESQNTIYKDGIIPFSGINNVTFKAGEYTTEILFDTKGGNTGNAGKLIVANDNLATLVNTLKESLSKLEDKVNTIDFTTATIINLDKVFPTDEAYSLQDAVTYVANLNLNVPNIGILYNDNGNTKFYFYSSKDLSTLKDIELWKEVQIGSGKEVINLSTKASLPAIGKPDTLYIIKDIGESYYWDDSSLMYRMSGFDINNITLIDSNFSEKKI